MVSDYFIVILIFTFLIFFIFFSGRKLNKIKKNILPGVYRSRLLYMLKVNIVLSFSLIVAVMLLALCFTFFPRLYDDYCRPILSLNHRIINSMGLLIIKISFTWLIGSGFQVSGTLDESQPISLKKIRRIEILSLSGIVLLCLGIFVFISSFVSLFLFIFSAFLFLVFKKNQDGLLRNFNQH